MTQSSQNKQAEESNPLYFYEACKIEEKSEITDSHECKTFSTVHVSENKENQARRYLKVTGIKPDTKKHCDWQQENENKIKIYTKSCSEKTMHIE